MHIAIERIITDTERASGRSLLFRAKTEIEHQGCRNRYRPETFVAGGWPPPIPVRRSQSVNAVIEVPEATLKTATGCSS